MAWLRVIGRNVLDKNRRLKMDLSPFRSIGEKTTRLLKIEHIREK